MSSPSISVMKFGTALIFASPLRQSCWVAQDCASFCIVASCTPCDASETCSGSGHFVALTRLRRSSSASFEAVKRKGRIALGSVAEDGSTLAAPPAAEAARMAPGVGDEKVLSDMIALLGGKMSRQ